MDECFCERQTSRVPSPDLGQEACIGQALGKSRSNECFGKFPWIFGGAGGRKLHYHRTPSKLAPGQQPPLKVCEVKQVREKPAAPCQAEMHRAGLQFRSHSQRGSVRAEGGDVCEKTSSHLSTSAPFRGRPFVRGRNRMPDALGGPETTTAGHHSMGLCSRPDESPSVSSSEALEGARGLPPGLPEVGTCE